VRADAGHEIGEDRVKHGLLQLDQVIVKQNEITNDQGADGRPEGGGTYAT